jgi:hypothetical protein
VSAPNFAGPHAPSSPVKTFSTSAIGNWKFVDPVQKQGRPVPNQRSGEAERLRNSCSRHFKTPRNRGTAKVDLQNQFIGSACHVKGASILAQPSRRMDRSKTYLKK